MAITIDWGTKIISVPQSFLTHTGGTNYTLDTNAFHIALKDLEDDEEGIAFPPTHKHNTVVTLGGIQYARIIEIINGYTITFENVGSPYAVSLIGSNNNILDVTNLNNVAVRSNNSAGLINVTEVQQIVFGERIHLDVVNGSAGTLYPKGTPLDPVNNLSDALAICAATGLPVIHLLSALTIPTGANIDGITITSGIWPVVTIEPGVAMENANFERLSLYGEFEGFWNILIDCWVYDITNFCGWVRGGSIGEVSLAVGVGAEFGGQTFMDNIVPLFPGQTSTLTMNTDTFVSITGSTDITTIKSLTTNSSVFIGMNGGSAIIDATCTGGSVIVSGAGNCVNNSGLVVDSSGLAVTLAAAQAAPIHADARAIKGQTIGGSGTEGDPWGPV